MICIKKLIVNKKYCREKLVLERRLVCKKKAKNCVKRSCRCKNVGAYETNAHPRRILVIPFRTNAGDILDAYLTFILLTLQTYTKLKTTFGRNLLSWML
jgi:hypothetical protein